MGRRSHESCGCVLEHNQVDGALHHPLPRRYVDTPRYQVDTQSKRVVPQVNCDTCCFKMCVQSLDESAQGTTELTKVSEQDHQTVSFLENGSVYSVGTAASHPPSATADATVDVSLNNFLSRPVKIHSFDWAEGEVVGTTQSIAPWHLFFSNSTISSKLLNYAWIRCDLKLKIMVNASPFYYGAELVTYQPLPAFKSSTIVVDSMHKYFIPLSQQPHLWIYPQNNEGGEMTLPFFLYKNYLSTVEADDFTDMGTLTFTHITELLSANGTIGTNVTISVYAWAENVTVSGPTAGLLLQSKDEYGTGPVSSMASAIADAAGALARIPLIKPYATATQMGARGVASLASKLGYCNTPVISDTQPIRPSAVPVLSSTEQGFPLDKLTIDPKNELSIDPQIVGLPPVDELNIKHMTQRESYLTTATWQSSSAVDSLIFQAGVSPMMFDMDSDTQAKLYMTPMAFVGNLFQYWRGDVIFRFRFLATQYHRGRVRIIFDPSGSSAQNITTISGTQPMCFNEVIDLTKDTNVEFRVPYNQAYPWLQTFQPTSYTQIPFDISTTPNFNHVDGYTNGSIAIRVVTLLTGPDSIGEVPILVSVRAADNLEFASPQSLPQRYSQFEPQSLDEYDMTPSHMVIAGHAPSGAIPEKYLINHGESIMSLRQILRRYNLQYVRSYSSAATVIFQNGYNVFTAMPANTGYDPEGQYTADELVGPGSSPYNYVAQTPLTYISSAFIGYRGSVNYCLVPLTATSLLGAITLRVMRLSNKVTLGFGTNTTLGDNTSITANYMMNSVYGYDTAAGVAMTHTQTNAGLTFACPMYSRYKFLSLDKTSPTLNSWGIDDRAVFRSDITMPVGATNRQLVNYYAAIGTDWNCHFFLNVPTFYVQSSIPTPL